jgi:hypothetical protein
MLQNDSTRFIFEKYNAFILMEIKYSTLHIHSLISSNFNFYASHFETINLTKGIVQTNDLIDVMNPLMMCSPLIYSFHQSHSLHPNFYDKIAEWLEDSYKKNVQGNGKIMLALFLNDDDKGKYDIFLSFFDILPFLLVIFYFVFIAGLDLL